MTALTIRGVSQTCPGASQCNSFLKKAPMAVPDLFITFVIRRWCAVRLMHRSLVGVRHHPSWSLATAISRTTSITCCTTVSCSPTIACSTPAVHVSVCHRTGISHDLPPSCTTVGCSTSAIVGRSLTTTHLTPCWRSCWASWCCRRPHGRFGTASISRRTAAVESIAR